MEVVKTFTASELFQAFQYCTVQLFWMPNFTNDIQLRFLEFHRNSSQAFPVIQTQNKEYKHKVKGTNTYNKFTYQTNLHFKSHIYYKTLNGSKYSSFCTLQLPAVKSDRPKDIESYFSLAQTFRKLRRFQKSLYLVDYILFLISIGNRNALDVSLNVFEFRESSKVILFSPRKNILFVPCPPSQDECWVKNQLRWIIVKQIHPALPKGYVWKDLERKTQNHVKSYNNQYIFLKQCSKTKKKLKKIQDLISSPNIDCLKTIIIMSINCTSVSCISAIQQRYNYGVSTSLGKTGFTNIHTPRYFAFGGQFHGYKYSVFVNERNNKEISVDFNAFQLLSPFGTSGWIMLSFSFLYLWLTLKITGFDNTPLYWLYAILLEQEDHKRKYVNFHNWKLVTLWLLACHLIRCQYTSSMYTYMTKGCDPLGIPNSFNELIFNNSMPILSNDESIGIFRKMGMSIQKNLGYLDKLFESSSRKIWWYFDSWANLLRLAYSGNYHQERFLCDIGQIRVVNKTSMRAFENQLRTSTNNFVMNCTTLHRFALFFKSNLEISNHWQTTSTYTKLILMLFGEYLVFENNDDVVFSELYVWYSYEMDCLGNIFSKKVGSLVESGIYTYYYRYDEIANQIYVLQTFDSVTRLNRNWTFSLVHQLISTHTPSVWQTSASKRLREFLTYSLETDEFAMAGTMNDFRYVWILYSIAISIIGLQFIREVTLRNRFIR